MHLHEVIEYRIEVWTQTFLKVRLTITEKLYNYEIEKKHCRN